MNTTQNVTHKHFILVYNKTTSFCSFVNLCLSHYVLLIYYKHVYMYALRSTQNDTVLSSLN